jgi:alpha,alpha-trehalase
MYREYKALSLIAKQLGKGNEAKQFDKKAEDVKRNVNKYLWDNTDKSYYNVDSTTGQFIKHHTYSNMVPLWAKLATPSNGKEMIKRYWVNPKYMWSKYGIRTLAKNDPTYNNANIIKPHSNWQGPVWPIANYLYMHGLLNYGYQKQAQQLAKKIVGNCVRDIETTGGMHENYDAETGLPLAAPNFVSWNLLVGQMLDQSKTKYNPFAL